MIMIAYQYAVQIYCKNIVEIAKMEQGNAVVVLALGVVVILVVKIAWRVAPNQTAVKHAVE